MEQFQRLKALADKHNLWMSDNDRLFYGKYMYRLDMHMYRWTVPNIYNVVTINHDAYMIDTEIKTNFVGMVRRFAKSNDERIRVQAGIYLFYYTSDIDNLNKVIEFVERVANKEGSITDKSVALQNICYSRAEQAERDVRYRKQKLPYGIYKFQILSKRMEAEQVQEWKRWAEQYPGKIQLENSQYAHKFGCWSGTNLGYVADEKMLQLVQFKLGPNIGKVIEYKIKEDKKQNDE